VSGQTPHYANYAIEQGKNQKGGEQKVSEKLMVTSSPHINHPRTTRGIMLDVIIALMFPAVASVVFFGYRAAVRVVVCVVACVVLEWAYCKLTKKPGSIGDLSAVVTGMLLAFNLPAGIPIWQALVGCFVAIVIVKQLFGGIGCNFVNPALAGRVVMALSFTTTMVTYSFPGGLPDSVSTASPVGPDALASATPLNLIETGGQEGLDLWTLFVGNYGGVLGETSALALTLGFVYLVARGVIKPIIPISFIASTLVFSWLFGCEAPLAAALSGGLFLGAIFMATDYTTSPYTNLGKLVFGLGCGLLTALIRTFANSTEGVSYAILIMNLLVPYINDLTRGKPFGTGGAKIA
jgi:electron transport complex protein RnfD